MDTYHLPNGIEIDVERMVEVILRGKDFPELYLDIKLGILIEVPSRESLEKWVSEIGTTGRYLLIESYTSKDYASLMNEFTDIILRNELPKKLLSRVYSIANTGNPVTFEEFLMFNTDGWHHGWEQFRYDAAWEYILDWFEGNPYVDITEKFDGDDDCLVCSAMKNDESDIKESSKFDAILEDVEKQLIDRARNISKTSKSKGDTKVTKRKKKKKEKNIK